MTEYISADGDTKPTRPVLFVDGPLEGTWKDVEATTNYVKMSLLDRVDASNFDPSAREPLATLDTIQYTIRKAQLTFFGTGGTIHVATCQRGSDAGVAILQAVLQRDVAHKLLGDVPKRRWP
jgi:hypothetical protein